MSTAGSEKGSANTKTPADFLKSIRGRPVVVKLNSGVDYRGNYPNCLFSYFKYNYGLLCHFRNVIDYLHFVLIFALLTEI